MLQLLPARGLQRPVAWGTAGPRTDLERLTVVCRRRTYPVVTDAGFAMEWDDMHRMSQGNTRAEDLIARGRIQGEDISVARSWIQSIRSGDPNRGELSLRLRDLCERAEIQAIATDSQPAIAPQRATAKRTRRQSDPRPLTEKQLEAMQIVGECQGDIAGAARRLGKSRKTVEQHYKAGLAKTVHATTQSNNRKPAPLQVGLRGEDDVTSADDRRARIRPRDRRLD